MFNSNQYLEGYDIKIHLNSNLTKTQVIGKNTVYFSWANHDAYDSNFNLPALENVTITKTCS